MGPRLRDTARALSCTETSHRHIRLRTWFESGWLIILVVATVYVTLGTIQGYGPFALSSPRQTTFLLLMTGAMAVPTILLLGAAIFERLARESSRRQSEERLELALWGAELGLWDWNVRSGHVYFNSQWAAMLDFDREDLAPEFVTWEKLVHPEDLPDAIQMLSDHVKGETDFFDAQLRLQTRDGAWKWVHTRGKVTSRDDTGSPLRVTGMQWDIDATKHAQEALGDSEERLRSLLDTVPAYVTRVDRDLTILSINKTIPPSTVESVIGTPVISFVPPDSQDRVAACMRGVLATGEIDHYEVNFHAHSGAVHHFETWVGPVMKEGQVTGLTLSSVDVSKRKQAEQKLRDQEYELAHVARLSAMGQMVAGISHEINQPLYSISNFAEACRATIQASPENREDQLFEWIDQISSQANRAGEIIHRLRNFSRKAPHDTNVDLNEVIREAVELSEAVRRSHGVRVVLQLAASLPQVHADRIQIQQVVVNLIRNACDALLEEPIDQRQVTISTKVVDGAVEVAVQDRGCGLPDPKQGDIFDTFYTTKEDGLGMGLAISQSIVETHGGRLTADSSSDRGTMMRFTIPAALVSQVA